MKAANAIARILLREGVRHVFAVSGGASLHLIHGCANEGVEYICPQHEQAGGFMADAYARIRNDIGCAIATSGPGFTNLITPIAVSYSDSIPMLYIVGNTATFRLDPRGTRGIGFQFVPTVPVIAPLTKYAVTVTTKEMILPELEKCIRIAREGRRGPVVYDCPDDLQRVDIDVQR